MPDALLAVVRRYGGAPHFRRTWEAPGEKVRALQRVEGGNLGGVGLIWNRVGQVVLLRHDSSSGWGPAWVAPGGGALPGESPEETFHRETREEVGLRVRILDLTRTFDLTVSDGREEARGFLFQFEAMAESGEAVPGEGITEVRWFDELPEDMAFREDYVEAFRRRKPTFGPRPGVRGTRHVFI
ncbi:MAG: NUDIX hydrolase [Thermoplasmata archaeon]